MSNCYNGYMVNNNNNNPSNPFFLDKMVAHLGLRTNTRLYKEIGNIIAEIISA